MSKKTTAIYPGSFDPITNGHLDILDRALGIFDHVILAVADNSAKQPLFHWKKRCALIQSVIGKNPRVSVDRFDGLLVDYAKRKRARHVVRGLRAVADFEYEFQMALMNRRLNPQLEMVFLMTDEHHLYISSSIAKEVARLGGDVSEFVPKPVAQALTKRIKRT